MQTLQPLKYDRIMPENKIDIIPADRVSRVSEYYLQRKMAEVAELEAAGVDVVSLGIGGPDTPPSTEVIDALCESARLEDTHGYQPGMGIARLRKAFAYWYSGKFGVTLDPDSQIMPMIGSKEGILAISMTFLNPGDGVLVPNPGYPTYTAVSNLVGARIVSYNLLPENGWQPDFGALESMDLSGVRLMWVNYPNMPTGGIATRELFQTTVNFARRHNILVVNDNPYSFILNNRPLSILAADGAFDVAMEMNSLSKSHSMAGWRVGMLAGNPQFIKWVRRVKSNVDSGQFRPIMEAAAVALQSGPYWYATVNGIYFERRVIAEEIAVSLGCTYDVEQRGLFLWCRIPDSCPSGEVLADRLLAEARVFVTPGFIFGSQGDRYIRISLCASPQRMYEALRRVRRFMEK